jgi:hypothetical protein
VLAQVIKILRKVEAPGAFSTAKCQPRASACLLRIASLVRGDLLQRDHHLSRRRAHLGALRRERKLVDLVGVRLGNLHECGSSVLAEVQDQVRGAPASHRRVIRSTSCRLTGRTAVAVGGGK